MRFGRTKDMMRAGMTHEECMEIQRKNPGANAAKILEIYLDQMAALACTSCQGSGDSHAGGYWHDCPACMGTGARV